MTEEEARTLEAMKYAASMGYPFSMLKDMFAPFTIKRDVTVTQPEQEQVAYCYVQKGTSVDILTFDDAPDDAVDSTKKDEPISKDWLAWYLSPPENWNEKYGDAFVWTAQEKMLMQQLKERNHG